MSAIHLKEQIDYCERKTKAYLDALHNASSLTDHQIDSYWIEYNLWDIEKEKLQLELERLERGDPPVVEQEIDNDDVD